MKKSLFILVFVLAVGCGCEQAKAQTLQPQGGTMVRPAGPRLQSQPGEVPRPAPQELNFSAADVQGVVGVGRIRLTFDLGAATKGKFELFDKAGNAAVFALQGEGKNALRIGPSKDGRQHNRITGGLFLIGEENGVGYFQIVSPSGRSIAVGRLGPPMHPPEELQPSFANKEVGGQFQPDKPHNPKFPVSGVHDPNPPVENDEPAPDPRMPQVYKHRRK